MVRKMVLPAIFILSAIFIWPHQIVSGHSTQSILKDNAKFEIFIKIFLNNLLKLEKFSETLEEDMEDVIETLQTVLTSSTRHQKATNQKIVIATIASVIADMLVENIEDDMTIEERKAALRSALIQTYEEMGLETDVLFIQEMENLVQVFQEKKEKDDDEGYETEETVRESVAVDTDINKAKVSVDVIVEFKTKLFVGLKSSGVLNLYVGKQFTENRWYYLASLLVTKLDAKFNLNLGTSHVQSLFTAFIGVNTAVDINLCLAVIADFTSQLLYEKGILVSDSYDDILQQCYEIIFISLSDGLNININISTALNLALGLDVGEQLDLKFGVNDDTNVNLGFQQNVQTDVKAKVSVDVIVQFKTKLFVGLKSSGVFNLYVGKQFTKNQWYYLASLLVTKLDAKFNLNLGPPHVQSLFSAFIGVNTAVDINLCLDVIADFTSQLLYKKGILVSDSFDDILQQCYEIIFLSLSDGLNINIDLSTALKLALGLNVKTQVDLKLGLKDGTDSNLEVKNKVFSLKDVDNLLIYYATNFGKALTSSDDFDLAILSGDKESVILAIASAMQSAIGEEVSTAFLSYSNM